MNTKTCIGCGAVLQDQHAGQQGYTPNIEKEYCQRCFRLRHYDDLQFSMRTGIDPYEVLKQINARNCLVFWVVDLFDFEAAQLENCNRHLAGKDIVMVATKRDLLPVTLSNDKLSRFLFSRLKEWGIKVKGLVVTGQNIHQAGEEVLKTMEQLAQGREIVFMGRANAGKSTLINELLKEGRLTSSRYPGTTLEFNEMKIGPYAVVDTPGLELAGNILMDIDEKQLKNIVPQRAVKPQIYQLYEAQSYALAGLVRLDIIPIEFMSAVFYVSERLPLHRGRLDKADDLWEKNYGKLLSPVSLSSKEERETCEYHNLAQGTDVVIQGLGWISLSHAVKEVKVTVPKGIRVTIRKAMI